MELFQYVSTYGGWIEDKNLTLSYHYDEIAESAKSLVVTEMSNIVRRHGYQPMTGHNVLEIKPPVVWTKGHAAQLILENAFGNKWEKKVHVLYMGDDTSDEDVMRVSVWNSLFYSKISQLSALFTIGNGLKTVRIIKNCPFLFVSDVKRSINHNISYNIKSQFKNTCHI